MGTKLNPGSFDCYANAEPDEPMFVLLARDETAEYFVAAWAAVRAGDASTACRMMDEAMKARVMSGSPKQSYTHPKLVEANCCSASMRLWRQVKALDAIESK